MENKVIPDTIYGTKAIKYDPSSEYARTCPYCHEEFMSNHMLREFCPTKNGKHDYCKTKFKELQAESKLLANTLPVFRTPVVQPQVLSPTPVVSNSAPAVDTTVQPDKIQRGKVIEKIENLLQGKIWQEFSIQEIEQADLNLTIYDHKIPLPKSNLFRTEIGNYTIFWTHKNKILITHQSEILWISQL